VNLYQLNEPTSNDFGLVKQRTQQDADAAEAARLQKELDREMEKTDEELARRLEERTQVDVSVEPEREITNRRTPFRFPRRSSSGSDLQRVLRLQRGREAQETFSDPMSYEALTQLEDVKVGVESDRLEELSSSFIYVGQNLSEKQCSICMDNFETGLELRRLSCLHCFHQQCIDRWLEGSKRCPICNIDITQQTS